jgi:iron complex transport system ATP-binding protein
MSELSARQLGVRFGNRAALEPVDLEFQSGEFVALVGPNGAGKTTLLRALGGLVPASGRVLFGSIPLADLGNRNRARAISYLPQGGEAHWPVSALDLVALGRLPHRSFGQNLSGKDLAAVRRALTLTDVEALQSRSVHALSSGERARVLLARALAVEAPVLLVDEPTSALDPYHQLQIMEVLAEYAARPALVIAVMHDLALASRFCHRVILLDAGKQIADGAMADILEQDALEQSYRVQLLRHEHDGQPVILPWKRQSAAATPDPESEP